MPRFARCVFAVFLAVCCLTSNLACQAAAPETAAPPHAALHPRNAGNALYPSAGRLTRNLPFPPVAYIALALEAEEMISRSHAIPYSNHDRPRRFKAG